MKQIQDFVGYQIIQLCRAHRQYAERALNELGLHAGQEMILFQLWQEEGLTQSQLIEGMKVEPPTLTKMLQRMEKREGGKPALIERRPDANDARVQRVYLTEEGRSLEQPVLRAWRGLEERTLRELNPEEQALARRLLAQMVGSLV